MRSDRRRESCARDAIRFIGVNFLRPCDELLVGDAATDKGAGGKSAGEIALGAVVEIGRAHV